MITGHGSGLFVDKDGNFDVMGICLFICFVICIIFVLMNIFLTIINDSYMLACNDLTLANEDPELFSYLMTLATSVFFCFRSKNDEDQMPAYFYVTDSLPNKFDEILLKMEKVITYQMMMNFYFVKLI
jgi:hypothetical protein